MAICPHCQTQTKEFWAPKCHECNTEVGFFEQIVFSLIYSVVQLVAFVGIIWLVIQLIG